MKETHEKVEEMYWPIQHFLLLYSMHSWKIRDRQLKLISEFVSNMDVIHTYTCGGRDGVSAADKRLAIVEADEYVHGPVKNNSFKVMVMSLLNPICDINLTVNNMDARECSRCPQTQNTHKYVIWHMGFC